MLDRSTGTGRHRLSDRGLDQYWTPPCATRALLRVERLPDRVWEPAADAGAIVKVLRDHGHAVIASDIQAYDNFALHFTASFFDKTAMPAGCEAIVTNPPYRGADRFIRHALELSPIVIALLRLTFMESVRRTDILESGRLRRVWAFKDRLPMMHRHNWAGRRASSSVCFAWFVWTADCGPTVINRISHNT